MAEIAEPVTVRADLPRGAGGGVAVHGRRWLPWVRANGLIALVTAWFGLGIWRHWWIDEDGFIVVRVANNVLAGHGPVFNVGERVEAYTSPVHLAIVVLARAATFGRVPIGPITLVLGLVGGMAGLALTMRGSVVLSELEDGRRWVLPLGGIVFAAVPLSWDFATSGHEGSVGYLWIGLVWWGCAHEVRRLRAATSATVGPRWLLVTIGAGVLVRPDLGVFTVVLLLWWVWSRPARGGRTVAATLAWALTLPVAYEIFRMGYFGMLVSASSQAKLGAGFPASMGLRYLWDFADPFLLVVPLVALAAVAIDRVVHADRPARWLMVAFWISTLAALAFLVSIGGDYVNGRLLVIPFLALVAPIAAIAAPAVSGWRDAGRVAPARWGMVAVAMVVVVGWAVAASLWLRAPWYSPSALSALHPRFDERERATRGAGTPPRSAEWYLSTPLGQPYWGLVKLQANGYDDALWIADGLVVPLPPGRGLVVGTSGIGSSGVLVGEQVDVIDRVGLADPIAGHFSIIPTPVPGHLHRMGLPWVVARAGVAIDPPSRAALEALDCGALSDLYRGATDQLDVRRFLANLVHAPSNTFLSIPDSPSDAVRKFCPH